MSLTSDFDINLTHFRRMSLLTMRTLYRDVRDHVLATPYGAHFRDAAHFNSHVGARITETRDTTRAREFLLAAFGQLAVAHANRITTPPSDETLSWGGFLGGEIFNDMTEANRVAHRLLSLV